MANDVAVIESPSTSPAAESSSAWVIVLAPLSSAIAVSATGLVVGVKFEFSLYAVLIQTKKKSQHFYAAFFQTAKNNCMRKSENGESSETGKTSRRDDVMLLGLRRKFSKLFNRVFQIKHPSSFDDYDKGLFKNYVIPLLKVVDVVGLSESDRLAC